MIGDDISDSINEKNVYICEMMSQYWSWMNYYDSIQQVPVILDVVLLTRFLLYITQSFVSQIEHNENVAPFMP